jgi:hypothetical protein
MQPGQSVAQKLISVILPSSCCEVIFSPLIVVRFRSLIVVVCRLKNKSTATKANKQDRYDFIVFQFKFF